MLTKQVSANGDKAGVWAAAEDWAAAEVVVWAAVEGLVVKLREITT